MRNEFTKKLHINHLLRDQFNFHLPNGRKGDLLLFQIQLNGILSNYGENINNSKTSDLPVTTDSQFLKGKK